ADRRRGDPARRGRSRARARRVAQERRQGRARPVTALVTGGRGGIGRAIVEAHVDAVAVDLPEFDVGSREAWASLEGEFDAAFLNAGIGIGYPDVAELPDHEIARIVDANVLGVVYGARECARRLMPNGGSIVCTASLAGLTGMPFDPMYTREKARGRGFGARGGGRPAPTRHPHHRPLPRLPEHPPRRGRARRLPP